jgi:hypothetical protein
MNLLSYCQSRGLLFLTMLGLVPGYQAAAQAPTITSRTPARNAVAAPRVGPVTIMFSGPVGAATTGNIRMFGNLGQGPGAGAVSGGGTAAISLQPTRPFAPGEQLVVTVPATVLGTNGTAARREVYQFTAAAGTGPADFSGGPTLPLPAQPNGVTAGDVDNDGDVDLLTANGTASLYLNDGSGGFTSGPAVAAPAGSSIASVTLADVDGDGSLDLLTAGIGFFEVWRNTGGGSFARHGSLVINDVPGAPVTADLDADGDLDLLLPLRATSVMAVRLNDGTGLFGGTTNIPMSAGQGFSPPAVADVDGDGDLDFMAAISGNFTNGLVNVRLNAGNGTFTNAPNLISGALSNGVALGDLDGDGDADLVVSNQIRDANVLLNNGNGTFASAPDVPTGGQTYNLALADVDGDQDLDLLLTLGTNSLAVRLNDGTGHFPTVRTVPVGNSAGLAVADLDGDQALDVAVAQYQASVLGVFFNQLPAPTITGFAPASGAVGTSVSIAGTGFLTTAAVLFNGLAASFVINGSGSLTATVPAGASSGPITVSTLGGTATSATSFTVTGPPAPVVLTRSPARYATAAPGPVALTFSLPIAAGTAGELRVWGSRSGGRRGGPVSGGGTTALSLTPAPAFAPGEAVQVTVPPGLHGSNGAAARPEVYQFTTAAGPGSAQFAAGGNVQALVDPAFMQPADLDGDGDLDLLVSIATGIRIFNNDGHGTFSPGPMVATFTRAQFPTRADLATTDLDNDGDLELVSAGGYFYRNNGSNWAGTTIAALSGTNRVKVGDVDADGDLDLLGIDASSGEGRLALNDGTGAFSAAPRLPLGSGTSDIELADVDADGDLDLLSANRTDNTVTLYRNSGRGAFGASELLANAPLLVDLEAADLDGDGDADLVFASQYDPGNLSNFNTVGVRLNDGLGHFSGTTQVMAYYNLSELTLADLNGDARPDILLAASNQLRFSLNDGSGGFAPVSSLSLGNGNPAFLSAADYNGDGTLDLAGIYLGIGPSTPLLFFNQPAPPDITGFTPPFGLPGTVVTVTGHNFINVTGVQLNGQGVPGFVVNSPTSFTFTVPPGATSGYIVVNTPGGGASSPQPFNVTNVPPDLVVSSSQNVQGIYNDVTVTGTGVAYLTGPLTVTGTLTVMSGGQLNTGCQPLTGPGSFVLLGGATLDICDPAGITLSGATGAVQVAGPRTYSPRAFYRYSGAQAQVTGPGLPAQVERLSLANTAGLTLSQPLALTTLLRLSRGTLSTNGQALTLLSTASRQAWVENLAGEVQGDATVLRFIFPFPNPGLGYRHFSAPIGNARVSSLATPGFIPVVNFAYNGAASPGIITPYPTVYGYDPGRLSSSPAAGLSDFDKGWFSPASLSSALVTGLGYTVNLAAGQAVAFTGRLTNGDVTLPLARPATPVADGGWQLIGNPYPSPFDWSLVDYPAGLELALYVYRSTSQYGGSYARYVNGIGNPVVDVGQAFFVRVRQPGSTVSLTLSNDARRIDLGPAQFSRGTADRRPRLHLRLADAAGRADETIVYFEAGASPGFDGAFDAHQLAPNTGGEPSVWTVASGGETLGISGLPPLGTGPVRVSLGLALPQAGTFTFAAPTQLNTAGLSAWLDDAVTGRTVRLTGATTYRFTAAAGTLVGRFALRFAPAYVLASAAGRLAEGMSLYPNPAREQLTVLVPPVAGGAPAFTVELLNILGQVVARGQGPLQASGGQCRLPLMGRAAGLYLVRIRVGETLVSRPVMVE